MRLSLISMAAAQLGMAAAAEQLCAQFAFKPIGIYEFSNNLWGKDSGTGSQCLIVDRVAGDTASWHVNWQWNGGPNNVKSFPWVGAQIKKKPLVSTIKSMPTRASWNYAGGNLRADVAYDLFTAKDPNHKPGSGEFEIMIWLAQLGGVQPIGKNTGTVNIAGHTWDLFDGTIGTQRTFSYIAKSQINNFSGDVMDFFRHLKATKGFPSESQHLLSK